MFWANDDDERVAFFVAVARAKDRLLLTHAQTRQKPAGATYWQRDRNPYQEFLEYADEPDPEPS